MPTRTNNKRRYRISITLQVEIPCGPTSEEIEQAKKALEAAPQFRAGPFELAGYDGRSPYQNALRAEMFWRKVKKEADGCWLWHGKPNKDGYGIYTRHGILAHRMSYILTYGPISEGLLVLHSCDVRHCVRPDHLRLGSHQGNMNDIRERGGGSAKLSRSYPPARPVAEPGTLPTAGPSSQRKAVRLRRETEKGIGKQ